MGMDFGSGRLQDAMEWADCVAAAAQHLLDGLAAHQAYLESGHQKAIQDALHQGAACLVEAPLPGWPWSRRRRRMRARVSALAARLHALQRQVKAHNPAYEAREMAANADLFTLSHGDPSRTLSRSQQEAIVRDDRWNLIVASAGSGKTATLIHRIAYLLRKGVQPHRILAVTFTHLAAEEMSKRLQDRFGCMDASVSGVQVSTFHALGKKIITKHRGSKPETANDQDLPNSIWATLEREAGTPGPFQDDLLAYLSLPDREPLEEDFASKEDYYRYMQGARHQTLLGEIVKSQGEKQIADFLTLHGIRYAYEEIAEWVPKEPGYGNYRPDFTLKDHPVTIEHWAARDGERVPKSFGWSPERYHAKMAWARRKFTGRVLVETYHDEFRDGKLDQALRKRLAAAGVPLRPLTYRQLVEEVHDFNNLEGALVRLFGKWVQNAKTLGLRATDIPSRLVGKSRRVQAFGRCAQRMLADFDDLLERRRIVTFADMVHDAGALMRRHPAMYQGLYDHILVDEFQDTSPEKLEMLRALLGSKTHLFCVGDDWQSIYGFTGADVGFMNQFEECFGPATRTVLEESHRCPAGIVQAGNQLMQHNLGQIRKQVTSRSKLQDNPVVVAFPDRNYIRAILEDAEKWITEHRKNGTPDAQILVLSRYKAPLKSLEQRLANHRVPASLDGKRGIHLLTIHKAKGKERDHVLLLDASEGRIPSVVEDPSVLEPVRLAPLSRIEEERRLFYVALTRAKRSLRIQTRAGAPSPFIQELDRFVTHVSAVQQVTKDGTTGRPQMGEAEASGPGQSLGSAETPPAV